MATEDIIVRPYQPGDEEGIIRLFNEVFREDEPGHPGRTLQEWRWEFLDNPAGTQVVLGVEPGGRIIAQYACLPARANLRGEDVCCGQGIDSVVHKDYRRGLKREGAFLKVARYYFDHYGVPAVNAFGYGFPNKRAYRIGVRMLGYTPIAAPVPTIARNLLNFKTDLEVGKGADPAGEVLEVARFDAGADRLWDRLRPEYPMAVQRTSSYLNWRYVDCPHAEYRCFALTDRTGEYRAIWILRANWMGPPILAVADLFLARRDTPGLARVLQHVVGLARATGQLRVELWVPPTIPVYDATLERGFAAEASHFSLCIKIYDDRLDAAWARANWFYTIGDSDVF